VSDWRSTYDARIEAGGLASLTRGQAVVLLFLRSRAHSRTGACWWSQSRMGEHCGMSQGAVSRSLTALAESGWIIRGRTERQTRWVFPSGDPADNRAREDADDYAPDMRPAHGEYAQGASNYAPGAFPGSGHVCAQAHMTYAPERISGMRPGAYQSESESETESKNQNTRASASAEADPCPADAGRASGTGGESTDTEPEPDTDAQFAAFWAAYPSRPNGAKGSRREARAAWGRLTPRDRAQWPAVVARITQAANGYPKDASRALARARWREYAQEAAGCPQIDARPSGGVRARPGVLTGVGGPLPVVGSEPDA